MSANTWLGRQVEKHQHSPEYELEWLMLDLNEAVSSGMQRLRLSRSELAERLGTSRAYVTKLLDGQENMTLKTLVRVANALEMKIDTRFIPREQAVRPAKKGSVKSDMGRGASATTTAKAARTRHPSAAAKTARKTTKRAVATRTTR